MMAAAYFTTMRTKVGTWTWGLGGFVAIILVPSLMLILQPDIGTLGILCMAVFAIFWVAGARISHLVIVGAASVVVLGLLIITTPYIRARVNTFIDPSADQTSQGYQIKQSLIAIGSGEFLGRGWGQGIEKFTYLPEPMGDSIFAVAGEELGFVGSAGLIIAFLLFGTARILYRGTSAGYVRYAAGHRHRDVSHVRGILQHRLHAWGRPAHRHSTHLCIPGRAARCSLRLAALAFF